MNLKEVRLKENLTLDSVAEITGIDKGKLSRIERGLQNATVNTLKHIADSLDYELIIEFKKK